MTGYPQVSINTDTSDSLCFGCGQNNPIGLKLTFHPDKDQIRTEFTAGRQYQGWPGILHGGIISCILDEAMSHVARFVGKECITARMEVRFKQPIPVEEPLVITSSLVKDGRKLVETAARIALRDGTVVAESSAVQFVVRKASAGAVGGA
ncbi:MAG: PaaI family thioesterase [Chloroflexi bacterium]|nr:PaaI family thioesterase [Chloroflexota bacterium]